MEHLKNLEQKFCCVTSALKDIQEMLQYPTFKQDFQKIVASEEVSLDKFEETLLKCIQRDPIRTRLRSLVYHWIQDCKSGSSSLAGRKQLDYLKKAQETWEARLWKSLIAMAKDMKSPLARGRLNSEQEMIQENWSEISQWELDLSRFKPVYSPKDFLDCILEIVNPNYTVRGPETLWNSFPAIPIKVATLAELGVAEVSRLCYGMKWEKRIMVTSVGLSRFISMLYATFKKDAPWRSSKLRIRMFAGATEELSFSGDNVEIYDNRRPLEMDSGNSMKIKFGDLCNAHDPHVGLTQILDGGEQLENALFLKSIQVQRIKLGEIIERKFSTSLCQEYLKDGCPMSLRGKIWQIILGSHITSEHSRYYHDLKLSVIKSDLLIDRITLKDVQLTAANNDEYFVFEDFLNQALLCFSRDVSVLDLFKQSSKSLMRGVVKLKNGQTKSVIYPPNGILPFHGFSMYMAPLCFLYDDPQDLYFTFRCMYCRYFFRLHEISSDENGILSLSLLFEKLLHRLDTELWLHFKALRILPIRVVFKWLIRGFSGYLPAEQLLQLWDLVLAYNSVQIFPLFALGVLSFRKANLMRAQQTQTVDTVLADLSSVAVLPILQIVLGKETISLDIL